MAAQPLDLDRYVPALIAGISNKLSSGASALYRRHFGLGVVEWRVLSQLAIEPWITGAQICQVIGLDKAAVSRGFRLLEQRQLVVFRDGPGRSRQATLTRAGRQMHDRIRVLALERQTRLLAGLSKPDVEQLLRLLRRLQNNIPEVNAYEPARRRTSTAARD